MERTNRTGVRFLLVIAVACPALFIWLMFNADLVQAQTVRGRLDRQGPNGVVPATYIQVTLHNSSGWRSAPAVSGVNGIYYFYDVRPGDYILEVWLNPSLPNRYRIKVLNKPYNDLSPILIP